MFISVIHSFTLIISAEELFSFEVKVLIRHCEILHYKLKSCVSKPYISTPYSLKCSEMLIDIVSLLYLMFLDVCFICLLELLEIELISNVNS